MKIASRLKFNTVLFAGVVFAISLLFALVFTMQRQAFERSLVADELMRLSYELNGLSDRYLRYPEERPREQWMAAYEALAGELDRETIKGTGRRVIVRRMNRNLIDMKELFDTLVQNEKRATGDISRAAFERQRIQIADLIIRGSREVTLDAARMASLSNKEVESINRRIIVFTPLIALVLAGLTAWTSSRIRRGITDPVNRLRAGAEIVGSGNLDHKIGIRTTDEIGELSAAFDAMTTNLKAMTVSRDELAKEIVERKRAEQALRQGKQELERYSAQLETIFNSITDGLVVADLDGNLFHWNPAAVGIHGFASTEEYHRRLPEFSGIFELSTLEEGILPLERWPLARILHGETLRGWEVNIRRRGADWQRVFRYGGTLARDSDGNPLLAVVIVSDITKHKRRDEELKKVSRQHELILQNAGEGIFGLDLAGNVTFVNAVAAHMLGYESRELLGSHSHMTWHYQKPDGSAYPSAECPIYAAYNEGKIHAGEEFFLKKDGTGFPIDFTSRPIYEGNEITGAVVVYRDITERKRAEEKLKRALAELERSNKELEQFAYVASHDLQEPLRMVASYVQLFEKKYKGQLDEKADKYIFFAVDGVKRMQRLIDGLLAYSRVARGAQFTHVDTNHVFSQAVLNLSITVKENRAVVTRDDLPPVSGDETQLVQLFQNLIGNAIKFRKQAVPPLVHISAKREGREWVFSVRDNGIGLDPQYSRRIFLIFQRLHPRDEYPGTGIGLALCKRIVERHHGRIWVESEPDEGSTFFFTMPMKG